MRKYILFTALLLVTGCSYNDHTTNKQAVGNQTHRTHQTHQTHQPNSAPNNASAPHTTQASSISMPGVPSLSKKNIPDVANQLERIIRGQLPKNGTTQVVPADPTSDRTPTSDQAPTPGQALTPGQAPTSDRSATSGQYEQH